MIMRESFRKQLPLGFVDISKMGADLLEQRNGMGIPGRF